MSRDVKMFVFLFEPTRWTAGIAWQFDKTDYLVFPDKPLWMLEISIQLPVFGLSIAFTNEEKFYDAG